MGCWLFVAGWYEVVIVRFVHVVKPKIRTARKFVLWYGLSMITSSDIQAARQARLRELRKAKFGSVKEAADHFRLSVNTLSSHESGRRKIDERAALKYASAFKVDPAYLLALDLSNDSKELSTTIPSAVSVKSIPVYGRSAGGVWLEGGSVGEF